MARLILEYLNLLLKICISKNVLFLKYECLEIILEMLAIFFLEMFSVSLHLACVRNADDIIAKPKVEVYPEFRGIITDRFICYDM